MTHDEQDHQTEPLTERVIEAIKHPLGGNHHGEIRPEDLPEDQSPEDMPGLPGAEGGSTSDSAHALPGMPTKDGAPLGSTDQHSDA
jgi:hypothetical protein